MELYAYDGTGINRLTDINPGVANGITTYSGLVKYNDQLYFGANDGTFQQLYRYDTVNNTASQTYAASFSLEIDELQVFDNKLFFCGVKQDVGAELWAFDGVNLWMTADLYPGSVGSNPKDFEEFDNRLFFTAKANNTLGVELYFIHPGGTNIINALQNNYVTLIPNPITSDAILQLSLSNTTSLRMSVTDISGKSVYVVPQQKYSAGNHHIAIPLNNRPGGIYFYQLIDEKGIMMSSGKIEKL